MGLEEQGQREDSRISEGLVLSTVLGCWDRVGRYIEGAPPSELFEKRSSASIMMDVMKKAYLFGAFVEIRIWWPSARGRFSQSVVMRALNAHLCTRGIAPGYSDHQNLPSKASCGDCRRLVEFGRPRPQR